MGRSLRVRHLLQVAGSSGVNQGTLVKCQDLERREYSDYPVERLIKGTESEGNHNRLRLLPDYKMKRVTGNSFN